MPARLATIHSSSTNTTAHFVDPHFADPAVAVSPVDIVSAPLDLVLFINTFNIYAAVYGTIKAKRRLVA